jgi:hypothetical protein
MQLLVPKDLTVNALLFKLDRRMPSNAKAYGGKLGFSQVVQVIPCRKEQKLLHVNIISAISLRNLPNPEQCQAFSYY